MNLRDPRWSKTIQLVMVPILSFGMGRFDVQQTHSTLTWVALALYSVAVAGFLFYCCAIFGSQMPKSRGEKRPADVIGAHRCPM
jgi:hypothetical protein